MSKSSSDKPSESKRPPREHSKRDRSNAEEQSDYYYDDSTGYEIYEDKDEDEDDSGERQKEGSVPL